MPYPDDHKQRSRMRILDSAYRLFTEHGFDAVSIDQLMADAGLTRGAFYAHFRTKGELYAEALRHAARRSPLIAGRLKPADGQHWLACASDTYLSLAHVQAEQIRCPLAFLVTDIAQREPELRAAYTQVFRGLLGRLQREMGGEEQADAALALSVLMVGGVALGRALDDEALVERLLAACRGLARELGRPHPQA